MSLAQFGFIVIEVGNRGGNPQRSKWYHNYGYGNLRDYGLADKKAAVEQLAQRHPFIDINQRSASGGHSGGGFMSTAAMLVYPDFFKVAVSESGNHENNIYNNTWSEKHHGIKEVDKDGKVTFEYSIEKNSELAKNLKGHLMLVDRRHRQQRPPGEHDAAGRRAHQGEQAVRLDRDSGRASRVRRSRGVLQLDPLRTISAGTCSARRPTASTSSS